MKIELPHSVFFFIGTEIEPTPTQNLVPSGGQTPRSWPESVVKSFFIDFFRPFMKLPSNADTFTCVCRQRPLGNGKTETNTHTPPLPQIHLNRGARIIQGHTNLSPKNANRPAEKTKAPHKWLRDAMGTGTSIVCPYHGASTRSSVMIDGITFLGEIYAKTAGSTFHGQPAGQHSIR